MKKKKVIQWQSWCKRSVALLMMGMASGLALAEETAWKFDATGTVPSADAAKFSDSGNWTAGALKADAAWSVAIVSGRLSKSLSVFAVGNRLVLRVQPYGMAVIVR